MLNTLFSFVVCHCFYFDADLDPDAHLKKSKTLIIHIFWKLDLSYNVVDSQVSVFVGSLSKVMTMPDIVEWYCGEYANGVPLIHYIGIHIKNICEQYCMSQCSLIQSN